MKWATPNPPKVGDERIVKRFSVGRKACDDKQTVCFQHYYEVQRYSAVPCDVFMPISKRYLPWVDDGWVTIHTYSFDPNKVINTPDGPETMLNYYRMQITNNNAS